MPKFTHDCQECKFLGTISYQERTCDLYYHPATFGMQDSSLIARYGNEEQNYTSGIGFASTSPIIALAATRAMILGHMDQYELVYYCKSDHFHLI